MRNKSNFAGRVSRPVTVALVLTAVVVSETAWGAIWSEINTGLPGAGLSVHGIAIAPKTPSTIYARASDPTGAGSLFKTTDGAATWKVLSSLTGVYSFVVDPQNASVVYAQTSHGLLKSSDGGDSWTGAGTGLPDTYGGALTIDPAATSTLYVAGGPGGVFKSTDGGGNWTALDLGLPPNSYIGALVTVPTVPTGIYALASLQQINGPGIQAVVKSADGGATWNILKTDLPSNSNITLLVPSSVTPSTLFATVTFPGPGGPPPAGVFRSTDGGSSWTAIDTGLPSGAVIDSLLLDPKDSSVIYLSVVFPFAEAGGILKSTDGGNTWRAIGSGLPANTPIDALAIDPAVSSTIYIVANGAILKSTDAGAHWAKATAGLTAIDVPALAVNRFDEGTVYAASGDTLFKSLDSGATWSKLFAFQITPPAVPVSIGSPFPAVSPAYPRSLLIDSADPNTLYTETTRGNGCYFADSLLFKSIDGGVSWTNSISPVTSGCLLGGLLGSSSGIKSIDPSDPNTLYLAETDDGDGDYGLLKTTNGGSTWNSSASFPGGLQAGVWALAIDPSNPATLYAGLDDVPFFASDDSIQPGSGGVFKSTDGGATWNPIGLSGAAVNLLLIDPSDPNVLYAATEGNYVAPRRFRGMFKSADGGATWSPIDRGLEGVLAAGSSLTALILDPANPHVLYAAAAGVGVFKTADAGATWSPLSDGLANLNVKSLALAPGARHILYAGTSTGVFRIFDTP